MASRCMKKLKLRLDQASTQGPNSIRHPRSFVLWNNEDGVRTEKNQIRRSRRTPEQRAHANLLRARRRAKKQEAEVEKAS